MFYIYINLVFNFFFRRCDLSTKDANVDEKEEKAKEIEKTMIKAEIKTAIKMKRLLNLR